MGYQRFSFRFFVFSTIAIFGLMYTNLASAHDPGLSYAELELGQGRINARLRFSQADIVALTDIDRDGDGSISAWELATAQSRMQILANDLISITIDDQPSPMITIPMVALEQDDGIYFELRFQSRDGTRLRVEAPLIGRFASGHRQFLSIVDRDVETWTGILSAVKETLVLDLKIARHGNRS